MFRLACIVAPWLLIQLHWGWVAHQEPPWCPLWYKQFLWKSVSFFHLTYCERGTNISPPSLHHANVCTFSTLCLPGSYIFVRLRRVTFKFGNFTNQLRRSFKWCPRIFPHWSMWKAEKTAEGSFIFGIHVDYMHEKITRENSDLEFYFVHISEERATRLFSAY